MNVLPLIQRELLVGARKRTTYWLRPVLAGCALLLGGLVLLGFHYGGLSGLAASPGLTMFHVFVWVGFVTTSLFGVFFAADAISTERRDGTLGLLFLTRLRAPDVVIAKLTATTLRTGFTLLAALPVLALPLLLGGVTFKSYGLIALVLANTLLLSIAAGLAVSSFTRQPTNGILGTLFLMLGVTLVPVWIDGWVADQGSKPFVFWASHLSPGFSAYTAAFRNGQDIWPCLGLQHFIAWLFLALAVGGTSRVTEKVQRAPRKPFTKWLLGTVETPASRRLRDRHPVQWLASRRSRAPTLSALVLLIICSLWSANKAMAHDWEHLRHAVLSFITEANGIFFIALTIWMAAVASRRTGDARREGALELLLATPLRVPEIVSGNWRGLCRVFCPAVLVVVGLEICTGVLSVISAYDTVVQQAAHLYDDANSAWAWDNLRYHIIQAVFGPVNTALLLAAVLWVGLWLGLRLERPTTATAVTWVVVVAFTVVVMLVIQILDGFFDLFSASSEMWLTAAVQSGLGILAYLIFIVWARRSLLRKFHAATAGLLPKRSWRRKTPATERLVSLSPCT